MKKGYFVHKDVGLDPASAGMEFAFLRTRSGVALDTNINSYVKTTRGMDVGLYQSPIPTAEHDAYVHSSQMAEDCGTFTGGGYGDNHGTLRWVVLNCLNINSLAWITTWVSNFLVQCPNIRPVLYITYDKWNAICKGDNILTVAGNLAKAADLCITKFQVEAPTLPNYTNKLYFWESSLNVLNLEETGIVCADSLVPTGVVLDDDNEDDNEDDNGSIPSSTTITSGGLFPLNSKTTIVWIDMSGIPVPTTITVTPIETE